MNIMEMVVIVGVVINLIIMMAGLSKIIGFFTRLESRLTTLEVLYDSIEKRKREK